MIHVCPECGERFQGAGACPRDGTALAAADDPLLGQQISSYRVTKLIGAGGMGRVYKAVQPSIGARVAIKVLALESSTDPSLVERFFAEARAVNLIRHEQIVNILDLARLPDGRPYIVMEYLDGAPLSTVLKQRGTLPLGSMARLAAEVLDALYAAHTRGIVHRDLKPDNIWVTVAGRAKVLDFGIAKLDPGLSGASQQTRAGSIMGTPPYMSPEQSTARPVDLRSDLYAMGIILYECVVGSPPFNAESLYEILRQHVEAPPAPLRPRRPDLPPAMEDVILRALAKDPAKRFADAAEMAQALMAAAQTLPAETWVELRTAGGSGMPGMPSGGIITPFGPRLPTAPPTLSGSKRSKLPLAAGIFVAVAAAGGVTSALFLRSSKDKGPDPVAAPVKPAAEDQAKVAAMVAGAPIDKPIEKPVEPPHEPLPQPQPEPEHAPEPPPPLPPPEAKAVEDPARFDALDYLSEAQRLARGKLADAELTQIIMQNVRPDGRADLTQGGYPFVKYAFRSTTASLRGDLPADAELECIVEVFVTTYEGVKVEPRREVNCNDKIIVWPRCSAALVWSKAVADGATEDGMATLQWMTDFSGQTQWAFTVGAVVKKIEDDCGGN